MTIRYDSFLTPFASPALGRIDVSGLEDAAKAFEQRAQYDQSRQDRLEQQAFQNQLEQSATEGKNRYYDAQAATHRMAQEQAKNAAFEKRSQTLFDAFRKAKTPNDRRAISDELKHMGYTVEEQTTDLPDTTAQAPAANEPPPVLSSTTYKNPPKPNKQFAAALGQIVTDENAQEAPVDESTLGKGTLASVLGVPAAGAMSGEMGAASAGAEVPAPGRGGKFVIKDKSGAVVHSYDEPLERMKTQTAIKGALGAMGIAATNDRERNAVDAAATAGANMLDLGIDPGQAVKYAVDIYGKTLNEKKYAAGGGGGGGAAGPTKTDIKLADFDEKLVQHVTQRVAGNYEMKEVDQSITMAKGALASLRRGGGMSDLDAFKRYLLAMSGKVVTDKEMDQFLSSTGKWTVWEKMVNEYTQSGEFPPAFKAQLESLMEGFIQNAETKRKELGENAYNQVLGLKGSPEAAAVARGHFTGNYAGNAPVAPLRGGKPAAPGPAAPAGGLSSGAADYLENYGGKK